MANFMYLFRLDRTAQRTMSPEQMQQNMKNLKVVMVIGLLYQKYLNQKHMEDLNHTKNYRLLVQVAIVTLVGILVLKISAQCLQQMVLQNVSAKSFHLDTGKTSILLLPAENRY